MVVLTLALPFRAGVMDVAYAELTVLNLAGDDLNSRKSCRLEDAGEGSRAREFTRFTNGAGRENEIG